MSAETAGLVIGLISDVISLIEACHTVYETAENAKGISEDFQKVAISIPMVARILENVKAIESRTANAYQSNPNDSNKKALHESTSIIEPVIKACKEDADTLHKIFEKAIPGDDDGRIQRYWTAVKTVVSGKSHKVEELMKDILDQLGLLQKYHYFKSALQWENIQGAIEELSKVKSSLSEDQEGGNRHYGSGSLNVNSGSGSQRNYTNSGSGSQYNAENQTFGKQPE